MIRTMMGRRQIGQFEAPNDAIQQTGAAGRRAPSFAMACGSGRRPPDECMVHGAVAVRLPGAGNFSPTCIVRRPG